MSSIPQILDGERSRKRNFSQAVIAMIHDAIQEAFMKELLFLTFHFRYFM